MKFDFTLNGNGTVTAAIWEIPVDTKIGRFFYTDNRGEGVFEYTPGNEKQLTGTSQFSIYGLKQDSARSKIKKWMIDKGYGLDI